MNWTQNGVLGEGGDTSRIAPNQASPGTRTTMAPADPSVTQVAMGVDPVGDPSEIDFGVTGEFVASVMPAAGMSNTDILASLATQLGANGLPAIYDPTSEELSLSPLLTGQSLFWQDNDIGLDFTFGFEGLDVASVPEPSTIGLCLIGIAFLPWRRLRRAWVPAR